ncbi:MAG: hypothetical protein ACREJ3_06945, partial [Polyangiaceae bacterium]
MEMHHGLVTSFGPLALAIVVSCGTNGGSASPSTGDGGGGDATTNLIPDASLADALGGADGPSTETDASFADGGGADAGDAGGTIASSADVLQMHKHINRDGLFVDGALTKSALMGHTLHIDPTFAGTFTGGAYASPLYVSDGVNHHGTFYVATEDNTLYALDETTGVSAIPSKSAGPAASPAFCGNINPLGITGTPAIDLATRLIVFDSATAASRGAKLSKHTIHA